MREMLPARSFPGPAVRNRGGVSVRGIKPSDQPRWGLMRRIFFPLYDYPEIKDFEATWMARGGLRLGAGRKKRDSDAPETAPEKSNPKSNKNQTAAKSKRLSPLDYMLSVINDPGADDG